jgi:LPXTG-motif cell wall-anchored protein
MHVKLNGVDVAGSPAAGVGGAGRTYRLLPGNYAVQEDDAAGYFGNFDGPDLSNGYVTIVSDQEVTVSRTNYDMFDRTAVTPTPPVVTPPVVTPPATPDPTPTGTVTGGELPKTGTPWNNLLALGAGLILVGAVGFTSRKVRGHLTR